MRRHLPMTNQGVTWICHLPMARWPPHVTGKRDWPNRPKNVCAAFQHTEQKVIRRKYSGTLFQDALDFNSGGQAHTLSPETGSLSQTQGASTYLSIGHPPLPNGLTGPATHVTLLGATVAPRIKHLTGRRG